MTYATRAEGAPQALPADSTRYYAGAGPRRYGYARCACPGCRSSALLDVASISREIPTPDEPPGRLGLLRWLAQRALRLAHKPLGWLVLEYGCQRFDVCSHACLGRLSELLA